MLDGEELSLTRREFDLLAILVRNAGTVLTREHLIDEVWDTNWFGSTKTLDVHVSSLRRKLGDDAVDSRYLHTVRGVGFRFAAPDAADDVSRPSAGGLRLRAGARDRGAAGAARALDRAPDRPRGARAGRRGAQLAAASASGRLRRRESSMRSRARSIGSSALAYRRGPHRPLLTDSQRPGVRGVAYGNPPEIAAALAGRTVQGRRHSDTLDQELLYTAVPDRRRAHRRRGAGHAERGRDRPRDPSRPVRADRRRRARAAARAGRRVVRRRFAGASAARLASTARRVGRATSTRARSEGRPSSRRSRRRSTRWPTGSRTRSMPSASSSPMRRISCARR